MKFTSPEKLLTAVTTLKDDPGNVMRSENRARIDQLMNGDPPFTEEELRQSNGISNYNSLEGPNILHNARVQCNNAYLQPGIYFSASLKNGPEPYRKKWSNAVTRRINDIMKHNLAYTEVLRATHAQMILHGIGPVNWVDPDSWCPDNMFLDDLLIPTKTLVSMKNLSFFAIAREYNHAEFVKLAKGTDAESTGWNQKLVDLVLKQLAKDVFSKDTEDAWQNPEKIVRDIQENSGSYALNSLNTVKCWDCYYINDDGNAWNRRIILQTKADEQKDDAFLFDPGDRDYAKTYKELIHFQFADGSNVAPFLYHSVRSLGWLMYQVCHFQNRLRCKFTDSVFESMMMLFRNIPNSDREFTQLWEEIHMGFIPNNITYVPANERFQVNEALVMAALNQNRQLMKENSASFTHDMETGTMRERTATETIAEVNTASALVGAMLGLSFTYQLSQYEEIFRRFMKKDSKDPEVKTFRSDCLLEDQVPEEFLDAKKWRVQVERTVGNGNKTLQMAQANNLMSARNLYDPDAQREILHFWTEVNSDDAAWANELVPLGGKELSDAAHDANLAIGTLMQGLPVAMKKGLNHIDYVETLLQLMGVIIDRIEKSGGMTTEDKIIGLANTAEHVKQHLAIIAQDDKEKQRVKQYEDILGQFMNKVKAYAQRLQEQKQKEAQAGPQLTPEARAKITSSTILAQTAAKLKEVKEAQAEKHRELKFRAEQHRKDIQAVADAQATIHRAQVETVAKDLTTQADINRKANEPQKTQKK